MGELIIMQGIPGSGKSYIARRDYNPDVICSADNYFRSLNPNYDAGGEGFDPSKLGAAHRACFSSVVLALQSGLKTIVVDNTNLENEAIAPYVSIAHHFNYDVEICRVNCNMTIAFERNTHGVPIRTYGRLHRMFRQWEIWKPHKFGGVKVREVDNNPNF